MRSNTDVEAIPIPKRGDVIRVILDPVEGSEQGGERPVLVISPDYLNARAPIFIGAIITSRKVDRVYSHEVLLAPPEGGLSKRSKVMLLHLRSLDRRRIVSYYGRVSTQTMSQVEGALRISTGLARLD